MGNDPVNCTDVDFNLGDYKNPGMGKLSGICKKKEWANGCKVNWDGVTNNRMVCYTDIDYSI